MRKRELETKRKSGKKREIVRVGSATFFIKGCGRDGRPLKWRRQSGRILFYDLNLAQERKGGKNLKAKEGKKKCHKTTR